MMLELKRMICGGLEAACQLTHPVTNHRPWLWGFSQCPFARLSMWLDERWFPEGDGHWVHFQ